MSTIGIDDKLIADRLLNLDSMEIKYFGHSCFLMRGKTATVLTDPFSEDVGLKLPKTTADVVTISHHHFDHDNLSAVKGTAARPEPFVVDGPGEYEVSGIFIYGYPSFHDDKEGTLRGKNTIYSINIDGIIIAHLGDLGEKLTDKLREELSGVDILLLPVGGFYTIGVKEATEIVGQIEPKIVIPMHYRLPGTRIKEIEPVETFLKEMAVSVEPVEKLVISQDKLPTERQTIVLHARSENSSSKS